jgi:RNA polymerase sigma-70 factor (ECF subfamily)
MGAAPRGDVTVLLQQAASGDADAAERLAEAVYAELRRIASRLMAHERRDHTLQPTAIAGEAYVNLVEQRDRTWENRTHFYAAAAQSMRRLLVDYGRRRRALKRGGTLLRVDLDDNDPGAIAFDEILAINDALDRLNTIDARQARIVELRYFGGLTEEETAELLQISTRTVKRDWTVARAWLYAELTRRAGDPPDVAGR